MTSSHAFTSAVFTALPVIVVLVAVIGGAELAGATVVAGLAVLLNVRITERLTRRFVLAAAHGNDPAAGGRLIFKQLTVLPLAALLMGTVGPLPVLLALGAVALGAISHAAVHQLRVADVRRVAQAFTVGSPSSPLETA